MKILKYFYKDTGEPGWTFSEIDLSKLNLLVGDTAMGKSRFLNTIFSLGIFVASNSFKAGHWIITFEHRSMKYTWEIVSEERGSNRPRRIKRDCLWKHNGNEREPIVERDDNKFLFLGKPMPPLSPLETSVWLLKEDKLIKPIFEAFTIIQKRSFSLDALSAVLELTAIKPGHLPIDGVSEKEALKQIFHLDIGLNAKLYLTKKYSYETYKLIIASYKLFFPFVKSIKFTDLSQLQKSISIPGKVPVVQVQEYNSDIWIPIPELSSGMQKVLLILTDVYLMPEEGVYIIDEYENSLGVSAIDFFPEFVLNLDKSIQFIITSHHPYLINRIPVKNWYVFHRDGVKVQIKYGAELQEKYGKSKQQAFLQLINDPFYARKKQ